jgi:hypothetical protein
MIFNCEEEKNEKEVGYAYVKGIVCICSFSTKDKAYKRMRPLHFIKVHQRFNENYSFA